MTDVECLQNLQSAGWQAHKALHADHNQIEPCRHMAALKLSDLRTFRGCQSSKSVRSLHMLQAACSIQDILYAACSIQDNLITAGHTLTARSTRSSVCCCSCCRWASRSASSLHCSSCSAACLGSSSIICITWDMILACNHTCPVGGFRYRA